MKELTGQTIPEYSLEESGKIPLTGKQLAFIVQQLLNLEVDSVVLSQELTKLVNMCTRITNSLHVSRSSLLEQELLEA